MLVSLAGLFFAGLWLAFASRNGDGIRQSFLYASAIHTLCVVLATELFSALALLTPPVLGLFWGGAVVLVAAHLWFYADRDGIRRACGAAWKRVRTSPIQLAIVALVLAATLLTALVSPPNSWDSMSYHMSRVAMWLQQGSVAHYQTAYLPQLYHPPLAEWHILHLQALAGGDRFANMPQWMAFAGCGIAASLLARELKAGVSVQLLAAVVALTLPMAVLQASSSVNDVVVAYWIAAMALFVIQYLKTPTTPRLIFCGLALGFALLSKGTAYVFAAPIGAVLFLHGFGAVKTLTGRMKLATAGVAIVAIALLLSVGHYARNVALFDHPLTHGSSGHINERFNVLVTLSNLVRGGAWHLGVPNDSVNALTLEVVRHVFGEQIDAIAGATRGKSLFQVGLLCSPNEAYTGSFLHFWALLASTLGVLLLRRRASCQGWPATVALAVVLGAVTYCSLIQWDVYSVRYQTPLFMLGAPVVALFAALMARRLREAPALARFGLAGGGQRRWLTQAVAAAFFIAAIPWLVLNVHRPLYASSSVPAYGGETRSIFETDRAYMYFNTRPELRDSYLEAIALLASFEPTAVGLYMNEDDFDYPLFPLLEELGVVPRIEHVGVSNVSAALADSGFAPMYVFSTRGAIDALGGATYRVAARVENTHSRFGRSRTVTVTILARDGQ